MIGLRWDDTARLVVALARHDHDVVAVHEGSGDTRTVTEESEEFLAPIAHLVEQVEWDAGIHDQLVLRGWDAVRPHVEDCDIVVLGRWHGWLEGEHGRVAVEWAKARGRHLVALEAPSLCQDVTVRWFHRWASELDATDLVQVVRLAGMPLDHDPVPGLLGDELSVTPERADRIGERLAGWGVRVAGKQWEREGDALGGSRTGRLRGHADTMFEFDLPDPIPMVVLASRAADGRIDALRMIGDTDAFEGSHSPWPATTIDIGEDGVLVVDGDDVSDQFRVRPGTWAVQYRYEPCGLQTYWIPEPEVEGDGPLGRCPVCAEQVLPVVYGMPSFETFRRAERGELVIAGCDLPTEPGPPTTCARCGTWVTEADEAWDAQPWHAPPELEYVWGMTDPSQ